MHNVGSGTNRGGQKHKELGWGEWIWGVIIVLVSSSSDLRPLNNNWGGGSRYRERKIGGAKDLSSRIEGKRVKEKKSIKQRGQVQKKTHLKMRGGHIKSKGPSLLVRRVICYGFLNIWGETRLPKRELSERIPGQSLSSFSGIHLNQKKKGWDQASENMYLYKSREKKEASIGGDSFKPGLKRHSGKVMWLSENNGKSYICDLAHAKNGTMWTEWGVVTDRSSVKPRDNDWKENLEKVYRNRYWGQSNEISAGGDKKGGGEDFLKKGT